MHDRSRNGRQEKTRQGQRSPADSLLDALQIDPSKHDLATAAAFRALAEEVIWLREEEARLRHRLEASEQLADRDTLCPVFNRRAFERELSREIALAARHGAPLCLVYIDLDRFKDVNDRFGHAAGDAALKQVCDILVSQVRQTDIIGRLGGDEFGVILTHAEVEDARQKAETLTGRIDRLSVSGADPDAPPVRLGASCGVVEWTGQPSADLFIAEADESMFRAKAARKTGRV
ncbi:GGDEF domain-containing protein [Henriciella sp.]|uniref:GGDEF domain-containing protein n=1 Tax=Henriciella sp. TaxID=1968823 RepID=UPI00260A6E1D|nr:GGDEF domain-containing protein [Henriciella sp.]